MTLGDGAPMTMRMLPLLLLASCGGQPMTIAVKDPSSVVVTYRSGHNLHPERHYPQVELRTAGGDVVPPAEVDHGGVELQITTNFYVLAPGTYRVVNHRHPRIKTLRRHEPRMMRGDRVTSDLDARTDTNDDRGTTTESWRVTPSHAGPYFVLVEEHAPDSRDDFRVLVLDAEQRPVTRESFLQAPASVLVSGATWVGPFTGPTTVELSTLGTIARRYSLRIADAPGGTRATRTAPLNTTVSGRLGPHSSWEAIGQTHTGSEQIDNNTWVDRVTFTNEHEATLYVAVTWTKDNAYLRSPWVSVVDDAGMRVAMTPRFRRDSGRFPLVDTGVYQTTVPHRGALHVRISGHMNDLTSGRYSLCVAADAQTCEHETTESNRLLSW